MLDDRSKRPMMNLTHGRDESKEGEAGEMKGTMT